MRHGFEARFGVKVPWLVEHAAGILSNCEVGFSRPTEHKAANVEPRSDEVVGFSSERETEGSRRQGSRGRKRIKLVSDDVDGMLLHIGAGQAQHISTNQRWAQGAMLTPRRKYSRCVDSSRGENITDPAVGESHTPHEWVARVSLRRRGVVLSGGCTALAIVGLASVQASIVRLGRVQTAIRSISVACVSCSFRETEIGFWRIRWRSLGIGCPCSEGGTWTHMYLAPDYAPQLSSSA